MVELSQKTIKEELRDYDRVRLQNERLRKALKDILGMSSAFEHAVRNQPYTHQSAEFVFKQARTVLEEN